MHHQGAAQGDGCVVVHVIAPLFTRSLTARPRRVSSSSSPLIASVTQRRHARDAGLKAPACRLGNYLSPTTHRNRRIDSMRYIDHGAATCPGSSRQEGTGSFYRLDGRGILVGRMASPRGGGSQASGPS